MRPVRKGLEKISAHLKENPEAQKEQIVAKILQVRTTQRDCRKKWTAFPRAGALGEKLCCRRTKGTVF